MSEIDEHKTIVAVDVAGFAAVDRTRDSLISVRSGFYGVLKSAFAAAAIPWDSAFVQDVGDGVLMLLPADIPKGAVAGPLLSAIVQELTRYNRNRPPREQIRLRMSVHAGDVTYDQHGVLGSAIIHTARLLDSSTLRQALSTSPGMLGVIVSSWFFQQVVRHHPEYHPESYRRVLVSVKETQAEGWMCLPDAPDQPIDDAPGSVMVGYVAPDRDAADRIAGLLSLAGWPVRLEELDLRSGENFADRLSGRVFGRSIVVVSAEFVRRARTMSESTARLPEQVIPVQIEAVEGPRLDGTVDLVEVDEETARGRLLAAVCDPGTSRAVPELMGPARGAPVLLVHSMPDLSFAAELSDALFGLTTEAVVSSVELRAVGQLDEETSKIVDPRISRQPGIVLMLISRDLLATGYGASREVLDLLQLRHTGRVVVRLVILKPTAWENQRFGMLSALPTDGVPVSKWASRDDAVKSIVDGVRLAAREITRVAASTTQYPRISVQELGDVFKPAGIPVATFVEPDDFVEFKMALRHPGLGVVLEGPSGIGKTTLLKHAVKQDANRLGDVPILSARRPADISKIKRLVDGHEGLVAVDDFQRLPPDLQHQLGDYLKLLADDDGVAGKMTLVGIPGTAKSLVELAPDVATRIRVFKLGRVAETLLLQMIEKGEAALNITFESKTDIAMASAGSLLTAQMLCWHLAMMAGVERTVARTALVRTDISRARKKVTDTLHYKYQQLVDDFIVMDDPTEPLCIDLLLALAAQQDGILRLQPVADEQPGLSAAIERVFVQGLSNGLNNRFADHLYYDPRGHRLIADDPQFLFYLRQLSRAELLEIAGKQLPSPRDQIFVCYSRKDAEWLDRVQVHLRPLERHGAIDLWSDRRIEAGDMWRKEITAALARARVALLLISADFFASDFIHSEELPSLLAAADQGGCRVIPLLLRPSMFKQIPEISRFNSIPSDTTLSELPAARAERVLVDLARSLSVT